MLGFVPNEEAKKLIANSRALILPTQWYEGFPMTIVEAYSVGTPVVGSDFGNVGSVIVDGVTGMKCNTQIASELARSLSKYIVDDRDMVWSTKKEYEEKYAQTENYQRLIKIYNESR